MKLDRRRHVDRALIGKERPHQRRRHEPRVRTDQIGRDERGHDERQRRGDELPWGTPRQAPKQSAEQHRADCADRCPDEDVGEQLAGTPTT